jgi:hypothetical protein
VHSLCKSVFMSGRPIFFCGTRSTETLLPISMTNAYVLSAIEHLKVIDTISGARLTLTNGDTVFTLIPRHDAIRKLSHVKKTVTSLYALENAQPKAEIRGKTRIPMAGDDGKYTTVGLKPNRGCIGVTESWPKKLKQSDRRKICSLMSTCEDVAKGYIESHELRGLRIAQLLGEWPQMEGVASQPI